MLTPSSAQSPILSNSTFASNTTEQPNKIVEIFPRAAESSDPVVPKSNPATKQHNRLNAKRRGYSSMQQSIVYIVVITVAALLLIVAGVFVFKMQQTKPKEDLFTDMNQYYANGSTKANPTMPSIYPNASLNQYKNLI